MPRAKPTEKELQEPAYKPNQRALNYARLFLEEEGKLEFDDNPKFSRAGIDKGTYIQAWVWVDDEEVDDFFGK